MGLLRVTRASLNITPFLIQVISGGGIPVAEQVTVTGSVSFTVYVKVLSGGKVMLGITEGTKQHDLSTLYCHGIAFVSKTLTMHCESGLFCIRSRFIHSHTTIGTSIRGLCVNDG